MTFSRLLRWLLPSLLLLCIVRLWIMPLTSSLWVDEMVTVFFTRHGANHPSLQSVPQARASAYYALPRISAEIFGPAEAAYRLPSILAMALALFLIYRIASRWIHPDAGWFAVFACLSLRGIDYEAGNARAYALGTLVVAACFLFLLRWLDSSSWLDATAFVASAALLWRIHLTFWPFYLVFAFLVVFRLVQQNTSVRWPAMAGVFLCIGALLFPVVLDALTVLREAPAHVTVPQPTMYTFLLSLKFGLVAICVLGAFLAGRRYLSRPAGFAVAFVAAWWLVQPLALFAFSQITGNSVYIARYLCPSLPGTALAATLGASFFLPPRYWKAAAAVFGAGVLIFVGQWRHLWPVHHNSDWRGATQAVNHLALPPETPIIYPSPFIEARSPVWAPDYALPGFLYCHLEYYPPQGTPYLLPFEASPEAEAYADRLVRETLPKAPRFVLYGGGQNTPYWKKWFAARPEFKDWQVHRLGDFGDVAAYLFEKPN